MKQPRDNFACAPSNVKPVSQDFARLLEERHERQQMEEWNSGKAKVEEGSRRNRSSCVASSV